MLTSFPTHVDVAGKYVKFKIFHRYIKNYWNFQVKFVTFKNTYQKHLQHKQKNAAMQKPEEHATAIFQISVRKENKCIYYQKSIPLWLPR